MRFAFLLAGVVLAAYDALLWTPAVRIQLYFGVVAAAAFGLPFAFAVVLRAKKTRLAGRWALWLIVLNGIGVGAAQMTMGKGLEDASFVYRTLTAPPPPPPAAPPPALPAVPPSPRPEPVQVAVSDAGGLTHAPDAGPVASTPTPEPEPSLEVDAIVRQLNAHRAIVGLPPVSHDPLRSDAAGAHAKYIAKNYGHPSLQGLSVHEEDPSLPGYSELGDKAGKASVISFDARVVDPVDGWMRTFFHRVPLLRPELSRVGLGTERFDTKDGALHVWVLHTGDRSGAAKPQIVVYPADQQQDVPRAFIGHETPNPIPFDEDGKAGFPITITFPAKVRVTGVSATLEDVLGTGVAHYLSTPDSPAHPDAQQNTICLMAEDPLEPNSSYTARVSAVTSDGKWSKHWTFKTGRD